MTQPKDLRLAQDTETQYLAQKVNGPLQPLPKIIKINEDWVKLGDALFHSPLLSNDNTVSCSTCHVLNNGGGDAFPVSVGINNQIGERNSPTVLNAALNFRQFWDGRSTTLDEQVIGPIHNPLEMGSDFPQIIQKLKAVDTFNQTFNQLDPEGITEKNIIKALVVFQQSLITYDSAIDRYLLGDANALTEQQIRGLETFTKRGCITCHQGRNIGGNLYQKLGRIGEIPPHLLEDQGRFKFTKDINDLHVYKVPSLRNVALTAPYFHNGEIKTLPEAVSLMGEMQLGFSLEQQEVNDIVALLDAFTGKVQNR